MDGFTSRARPRALLKLWQTQAAGRVYRSTLTALSVRKYRADQAFHFQFTISGEARPAGMRTGYVDSLHMRGLVLV